jgi:hypothetical protein
MSAEAQLTPMMAQYRRIKGELPKDALLLFRLGDFYEMFFEDAQTGAQLLNLALTARNGIPMCGLPYHAANNYIARILKAGRKVAICEQLEEARPGKLVKREVTQILSPGTHFDERMLVAERNNFLAAVIPPGKIFGLALVDLTTGDFLTTELENDAALLTELERLRPAEIIFPPSPAVRAARQLARRLPDSQAATRTGCSRRKPRSSPCANISRWPRSMASASRTNRRHRRGGRGAALSHPAPAPRCQASHAAVLLPTQRFSDAGLHDAAAPGNSGTAASRRPAQRLAVRRAEPHRHADGRAPPARLAFAAARHHVDPFAAGRRPCKASSKHSGRLDRFRRNSAQRARPRTHPRPPQHRQRQRPRPRRPAQALEQIPALKQTLCAIGRSRASARRHLERAHFCMPGDPNRRGPPWLLDDLNRSWAKLPDLVELIGRAIVEEPPLAHEGRRHDPRRL